MTSGLKPWPSFAPPPQEEVPSARGATGATGAPNANYPPPPPKAPIEPVYTIPMSHLLDPPYNTMTGPPYWSWLNGGGGGGGGVAGVSSFNKRTGDVILTATDVTSAGGLTEAPTDGSVYGRGNSAWSKVLPIIGGTLTGPLTLSGDPTSALQPATKQYVDAHSGVGGIPEAPTDGSIYGRGNSAWSKVLPLSGGTLTGPLTLSGDPTAALGAATKQYVDAHSGGGGGTPGGTDGQIQFNNSGSFAGFGWWNKTAGGLKFISTNPNANNDSTDLAAARWNVTYDGSQLTPGFTNSDGIEIIFSGTHGQNTNGGLTTAKTTFIPLSITAGYSAAGQKNVLSQQVGSYGMGDTSLGQNNVMFCGGPVNGDEGQGWSLFSRLSQHPGACNPNNADQIMRFSITSATKSSIAAGIIITQAITQNLNPQTVSVSATTGINVGDWLIVGQELPLSNGAQNLEEIYVTAIGTGTITAQFLYTHNTGATLTAALVLQLNKTNGLGQQRFLVDETAPAYTTGTVSSISGGGFNGTGTTWTVSMVGGNATNIGAVCLAADSYTGPPFGPGFGTLDSWYLIRQITSTTGLAIMTFSTAGDLGYYGYGPGSGAYTIRQSARILRIGPNTVGNINANTVICETSTSTWTVGDSVLCPVCAYPDVAGYQQSLSLWTPGGAGVRSYLDIQNHGARSFKNAIIIGINDAMQNGSNSEYPVGYQNGINLFNVATGITIQCVPLANQSASYKQRYGSNPPVAIFMPAAFKNSQYGTGRINWGGPYMEANDTDQGLNLAPAYSSTHLLRFLAPGAGANPDTHNPIMTWAGPLALCGDASGNNPGYIRFGNQYSPDGFFAKNSGQQNFDIQYITGNIFGASGQQYGIDFIWHSNGGTVTSLSAGADGATFKPFIGAAPGTAPPTSIATNAESGALRCTASVWNGSSAQFRYAQWVATPNNIRLGGPAVTNSPITMRLQFLDQRQSWNAYDPIDAFSVTEAGVVFFGQNSFYAGTPALGINLDPANVTAIRHVTAPDIAGGLMVISPTSTTPANSTAAGTPGQVEQDGTNVYICYDANKWVKFAGTFTF